METGSDPSASGLAGDGRGDLPDQVTDAAKATATPQGAAGPSNGAKPAARTCRGHRSDDTSRSPGVTGMKGQIDFQSGGLPQPLAWRVEFSRDREFRQA